MGLGVKGGKDTHVAGENALCYCKQPGTGRDQLFSVIPSRKTQ